ncbi:hypothetical protein ENUP19_0260G0032 [Entamoeba nuttalli]|uniref:Wntless-like transmembrane domain-containing protein n=2 Tax=Entamoeba nuttalli TaxID=412467 RepID=K2GEF4_ENTNP|nr:hypothetical protein ENU1_072070 [Entamoeba nuttalli P19]EKE40996.1 hypothetical protein ENU1_072070 [Entamoeba nuttalli P19]|eukprot:XP_008856668.1 hypothetical protein ENU1_072070 [Entamoeba nuttalli P19]
MSNHDTQIEMKEQPIVPQVDTQTLQTENQNMENTLRNTTEVNTNKKEIVPLLQVINITFISAGFLVFLLLAVGCFVISVFVPVPYKTNEASVWKCHCTEDTLYHKECCDGVNLMETKSLDIQVGPFTLLNEEFRLEGLFKNLKTDQYIGGEIDFLIDINGIDTMGKSEKLVEQYPIDIRFDCKKDDYSCNKFTFFKYKLLVYEYYNITMSISHTTFDSNQLGDLILSLRTVNHKYNFYEIGWRFVFIILSCIVMGLFTFVSRKYVYRNWPVENKLTFLLLFVLILFNNPFFTYEYVFASTLFVFWKIIISSIFCVFVVFYVLVIFEALRKPISWRKNINFWIGRILFFCAFMLVILITLLYNTTYSITDINYKPLKDIPNIVFCVADIIFAVIYFIWLCFSVIRSFSEAKRVGNTKRIYTFGILVITSVIIFVLLLVVAFFLGFENSATTYLSTLSYGNLFIWLLSIFYIPKPTRPIWDKAKTILVEQDDIAQYKQLPEDIVDETIVNTPRSGSSDIE